MGIFLGKMRIVQATFRHTHLCTWYCFKMFNFHGFLQGESLDRPGAVGIGSHAPELGGPGMGNSTMAAYHFLADVARCSHDKLSLRNHAPAPVSSLRR